MRKWFLKLCQGILALLGVAAVISCEDKFDSIPLAYGTPTTDYSIKGKVVNMKQEVLKGIKIKPLYDYPPDSTYTNAQGEFSIERKASGYELTTVSPNGPIKYKLSLIVEDTMGTYFKDTVKVELVQVKEGDGWYRGEFEAKDVKITMLK